MKYQKIAKLAKVSGLTLAIVIKLLVNIIVSGLLAAVAKLYLHYLVDHQVLFFNSLKTADYFSNITAALVFISFFILFYYLSPARKNLSK